MADETVDHGFDYTPNTTLGRSGHQIDKETRLGERVEQLDALLIVCTVGAADGGFASCNKEIQMAALRLASDLATEVHELHEEIFLERLRNSPGELHLVSK